VILRPLFSQLNWDILEKMLASYSCEIRGEIYPRGANPDDLSEGNFKLGKIIGTNFGFAREIQSFNMQSVLNFIIEAHYCQRL